MAIKFNDAYIDQIARAHLEPGETIVARTAGVFRPWWMLGIWYFFKTYLVLATQRRILLVEHRRGLLYDRMERVDSFSHGEISKAKVSGLFKKKLHLAFQKGRSAISIVLPGMLGPIQKSAAGAKQLVSTWNERKSLPAPARADSLPAYA